MSAVIDPLNIVVVLVNWRIGHDCEEIRPRRALVAIGGSNGA
ncbi:MAG TPA: hypothetical protein PLJ34_06030 [Hyphomicrobiales bacterium]|nr:hypothetical protein [Hyphomicrobiales bacterium]